MINLFSVKKEQDERQRLEVNAQPKQSAGELRLLKDLSELQLGSNKRISFPEGKDKPLHFQIVMVPEEGIYKDGAFLFDFNIPHGYPHDAPKVKCLTKVYHPNIDVEGSICLNILREDWKPVLNINQILWGLQYLFLEPNPDDPLNKEAAEHFRRDRRRFEILVQRAIFSGASIQGEYFPPCRS
eukprot:TRINITY_DN1896_c0_g1_i1.p2 TRINITY_DN1896_c0_g1~~TRINITY_DN1896_c0_g1_i1.p2  ORF type:complete len:184 (-),score=15.71 TRINITY_DN1896_c0_g1_i1:263-814(-)